MKAESPTKETEKTSTTSNPYLTGGPTRWLTPEQCQQDETEVLQETLMVVLKTKQVNENDNGN